MQTVIGLVIFYHTHIPMRNLNFAVCSFFRHYFFRVHEGQCSQTERVKRGNVLHKIDERKIVLEMFLSRSG